MSKAVTPEEVKEFHRLYEKHDSYAEVARITGRSASTIGKYIRMAGIPKPTDMRWSRPLGKNE